MSQPHPDVDMAIVGGGLIGISCALAAARSGFSVKLLDKRLVPESASTDPAHFDSRIYAITPGNMQWLRKLGVLKYIDRERIAVVDEMHIWGDRDAEAQQAPTLKFQAYGTGATHLAYIIEEKRLLAELYQAANEAGVEILANDCVATKTHQDQVRFQLDNGNWLGANLLIAADGKNSRMRELAGIAVGTHDYGQTGIVANFQTELPHQNIARQWFLKDSVMAWLPLPGNRISMVWSTSNGDYLLGLAADEFAEAVSGTGAGQLGSFKPLVPVKGFPLAMRVADSLIGERIVLLGDAAHQVHPLAGQGVNLGFRDVIDLLDVLETRKPREDIGSHTLLRRYERARKSDVAAMRYVTHGLNLLFESDHPAFERMRNWGMKAVEHQPLLKRQLIKQAVI